MLPEKLSNDVCSLRPGEDRLTMTCDMYLDASANVRRYEIYPSVICSKRRFDYDEVQEILDGKRDDPYAAKLARFDALAKFSPAIEPTIEPKGCRCGDVLRGVMDPSECPLFATACSPEHPIGPCMVSSEGSCAAFYKYLR